MVVPEVRFSLSLSLASPNESLLFPLFCLSSNRTSDAILAGQANLIEMQNQSSIVPRVIGQRLCNFRQPRLTISDFGSEHAPPIFALSIVFTSKRLRDRW